MKVGCTGCGYCQPCPSGVDIPGSFDLFNAFHTFGKTQEAGFLYVLRAGGVLSGQPGLCFAMLALPGLPREMPPGP